jgi:hypothetical protein
MFSELDYVVDSDFLDLAELIHQYVPAHRRRRYLEKCRLMRAVTFEEVSYRPIV